jgi:hypothetical protein
MAKRPGLVILISSASNFASFRELVLTDPQLQQQLRECESEHFVTKVVELGAALGYEFSPPDVHAAMNDARRVWLERWLS